MTFPLKYYLKIFDRTALLGYNMKNYRNIKLTIKEIEGINMGNIKLTNPQVSGMESGLTKTGKSVIKLGENGVGRVNWLWTLIFGVLIGLALPFLIDWALFGNPTPCHSVKVFEDGSSIQACEVRK